MKLPNARFETVTKSYLALNLSRKVLSDSLPAIHGKRIANSFLLEFFIDYGQFLNDI